MSLLKIVSGGQTGVDRGALDAALARGFPCGGWCPAGRKAEDGAIAARYPLTELERGGYRERTIKNVADSDATAVIHFGGLEGGTKLTVATCTQQGKPCELVDASRVPAGEAARRLAAFVDAHGIETLNVAGPRASSVSAAHAYARGAIEGLLALRSAV